jgi:hypothetical protein
MLAPQSHLKGISRFLSHDCVALSKDVFGMNGCPVSW